MLKTIEFDAGFSLHLELLQVLTKYLKQKIVSKIFIGIN